MTDPEHPAGVYRGRLKLRPATLDDAQRLLAWRNDAGTRAASFDSRIVTAATHQAWLAAALADPERVLMIAIESGVPVGTVRAEVKGDAWRLSWTVAPEARGRGVAGRMVKAFVEAFPHRLLAEIKGSNPASVRVAKATGFRRTAEVDGVLHFERPARPPAFSNEIEQRGKAMNIAGRPIGHHAAPFVIAEMSGNHNQSLERALAIVDAAAESGAHAIKLQTYTADTITMREIEHVISDSDSLWRGQSLYELYDQAHTPWEWHAAIFDRARSAGLIAFSSPFDETAVDFLEELDTPCYKIASFECTDLPLVEKVAGTGKPMIISTGMATLAEIDTAVSTARKAGARDIVLLKCTSTYPATPENSHLRTIAHLREAFGCEVGLSDHTVGVGAAVAAVALGATVIEKHFTLNRADGGVDAAFSLEPEELRALVTETERAWHALGEVHYGPTTSEQPSTFFRRSLFISRALAAGSVLTRDDVRIVRPALGIPPAQFELALGRRLKHDVKAGTPVTWSLFE
jgi:N-acetylneuraminate synthase